jgi:hypothetical protein
MPAYTVHEPPLREAKSVGEAAPDPERFVFVRDGFHFWAFLLGPLWMLAHRMWLVLVLYLIANGALAAAFFALRAPRGARFAAMLLLALLVGFEAATLRRFTLRNWRVAGVVVGNDAESAERLFFVSWIAREPVAPVTSNAKAPPAPPVMRGPPTPAHVIGLFPEPGGWR